jgi:hypothetical protein
MAAAAQQSAPQSAQLPSIVWSTIGEQATDSGLKTLVYGPAGVGKTVLCGTLPLPIIFINAESGALSLRERNLFKIFTQHLGMNPDLATDRAKAVAQSHSVQIRNGAQLRAVYEQLERYTDSYASVAWDSITETASAMLAALKLTKSDGRQAYGEMAEVVDEFVRKFRNGLHGKHICITAQMGSFKDEVRGNIVYGPDFPGRQLGPASPYWLDETFYMGVWTDPENKQPSQRYLMTQPDQWYAAKDRSGALDTMEKPDLSYLIEKIMTT